MLVSFISTQCANQRLLDCIRNRSTILKLWDSPLAKANLTLLRIWFCHTFNEVEQIEKSRVMLLLVDKKTECFSANGVCYPCNTVSEAMGCYYHFYPCQEARPSLTDTNIKRRVKKRKQDEISRVYIQQK